jgi:nardilysin
LKGEWNSDVYTQDVITLLNLYVLPNFTEFQMAVTSDTARTQQLLSSFAHSDNPARKFAWGNLITLRDNITDDDLYKAVHEFRKRHYSAHRMTLTIQVL